MLHAYLYREWMLFARSPLDLGLSLLPPLVTLLFLGVGLAGSIGSIQGIPYLTFILPGIAMMSLTTSIMNVASRTFNEGYSPMLREVLSLPGRRGTYVAAKLLFATFLASAQGLVFLMVGSLAYGLPLTPTNIVLSCCALFLVSLTLSGIFISLAVLIKDMAKFIVLSNVLGQVLIWGSTIFAPSENMPLALQILSYVNPLSYGSDLLRHMLLNVTSQSVTVFPFGAWLLLCTAGLLFGISASRLLSKRVGLSI